MSRTLEAIFRRPLRLCCMLALLPIIGLVIAYFLPRMYQTNATLWALRRYEVISDTGPESDLLATPAETQATALTELLQSRSFTLTVAKATKLSTTFSSAVQADPVALDDALFNELAKNVHVGAQGYNTFVITYSNHDPQVAQQVVSAVITNYGHQSQGFSVIEGQRLLLSYQSQLTKANEDATKTTQAEAQYISAHPNVSKSDLLNDPQYALLDAQAQQARATVQNIQTHIATLNQEISAQGTGADGFFKILDNPTVPTRPVSRVKELAIGGGGGLGVALLACAIYLAILIRRDRAIYTVRDIQKVTNLPIALQIPLLSPTTHTYLTEA